MFLRILVIGFGETLQSPKPEDQKTRRKQVLVLEDKKFILALTCSEKNLNIDNPKKNMAEQVGQSEEVKSRLENPLEGMLFEYTNQDGETDLFKPISVDHSDRNGTVICGQRLLTGDSVGLFYPNPRCSLTVVENPEVILEYWDRIYEGSKKLRLQRLSARPEH